MAEPSGATLLCNPAVPFGVILSLSLGVLRSPVGVLRSAPVGVVLPPAPVGVILPPALLGVTLVLVGVVF